MNLFVPNGNIGIYVESIDINGIIYAPNGTVQICGTDININGVIIAKEIMISAENVTVSENYNLSLAEYIMTGTVDPPSDIEIYNNLNYFSLDNSITILGSANENYDENLVIPGKINEIQVETIGAGAFIGSNANSITIPESIKSIGMRAFAWSDKLESITFSSISPPEIDDEIFYGSGYDVYYRGDNLTINVPFGSVSVYRAEKQLRKFNFVQIRNGNPVSCIGCNKIICECEFCAGCGTTGNCSCILCVDCGELENECGCCPVYCDICYKSGDECECCCIDCVEKLGTNGAFQKPPRYVIM